MIINVIAGVLIVYLKAKLKICLVFHYFQTCFDLYVLLLKVFKFLILTKVFSTILIT